MGKFYAVHQGAKPGVYTSWAECKKQVCGFKGSLYRSFINKDQATHFVQYGRCESAVKVQPKWNTAEKCEKSISLGKLSSSDREDNISKCIFNEATLLEIFGNGDDDFTSSSDEDRCPSIILTEKPESSNSISKTSSLANRVGGIRKRKLLSKTVEPVVAKKRRSIGREAEVPEQDVSTSSTRMTFFRDDEDRPVVFTDGACANNGKKNRSVRAGYGVWWGQDHPLNLSCRLQGIQTNQRAEIAAVNAALHQAADHGLKALTVKTDSMFIINCVTKWIPGWMKRNWRKADGKPVIHKNEFVIMLSFLKDVKVNWVHVRGHRGIHGNEMADRLAVVGAKMGN